MQEKIIENPSWEQIEVAIRSLNNKNKNDLYLHVGVNSWLCVGGGEGQYVLTGAVNDHSFPVLVNPQKALAQKLVLIIGGQACEYSANCVHDLSQTLQATRDFFDFGGFSSKTSWSTDEQGIEQTDAR